MRVFIPVTRSGLREMVKSGGLGPAPLVGYAVTPALREWYASGDEEELEYAAMTVAARDSLELIAAGQNEPARRLVVAVDAPHATPDASVGTAAVVIPEVVALRDVVAVHADTSDAEADVAAAVAVLRDGGPHDDDQEFVVSAVEAHELAWFATQEVGELLG
ncbi:MAG: hypothetical protein GEU93_14145 [Propionibacteriales bacterium]|nr:hypothetical protein [Propionibacteriales bacterium]